MKIVNGVQVVTLEVNAGVWGVMQKGLALLPYGEVAAVLGDLFRQVSQQSQPPAPPQGNPPAPPQGNPPAPVEANIPLDVAAA